MKKQINSLIDILCLDGDWLSSSKIANLLNVSSRQVRNYVQEVNNTHPGTITSGSLGYKINHNQLKIYNEKCFHLTRDHLDLTPKRRRTHIIKTLLLKNKISVYDLAYKLSVSESTIHNDIRLLRSNIEKYNLKLIIKENYIYLSGDELSKRKYMNSLINSDNYKGFTNTDKLPFINARDFSLIKVETKRIFENHKLFANDFSIKTIAVHLLIMIDRIKNNHSLDNIASIEPFENTKQYDVTIDLINYIESYYNIKVNDNEKYQLILMIDNNTSPINYSLVTINNINNFINKEHLAITRHLIKTVENKFLIDQFTDDFFVKFAIHISNMINRIDNNYIVKNPLTTSFKNDYPLIYELSVTMAEELYTNYNMYISEEEIAYIAFHLGTQFELLTLENDLLKVAFIHNDYYDFHMNSMHAISSRFEEQIIISNTFTLDEFQKIDSDYFDFIITSAPLDPTINSVHIGPIIKESDFQNIQKKITTIRRDYKIERINSYIDNFFIDDFLTINMEIKNKRYVLHTLCEIAKDKNYVTANFKNDIYQREMLSSTNYNKVAIPHSLSENVLTSFILVYIPQKPILWGNGHVDLVLLVGVNNSEIEIFSELLDVLVEILNNPVNVMSLTKISSPEKFTHKLKKIVHKSF